MGSSQQFFVRESTAEEDQLVDAVMATHGHGAADVHATFADLRQKGPVYEGDAIALLGGRSPLALRGDGIPQFSVLGHDEVAQVLREHETFSSGELNDTLGRAYGRTVLTMDPPDHRRSRTVLQQIFSKRSLEEWRESLFRPVTEAYVEHLLPRGGADLYRALLLQFPVTILHRLMGLPAEPASIDRFHALALKMLLVRSATPEVAMQAAGELYDDLIALIADRRARAAAGAQEDDLVSRLVVLNDENQAMSDDELAWFLRILLPAGAETTSKASGNMLLALLTDRSQWEALLKDRSLVANAVDEALRWDGATVAVYRVAVKDAVVGGVSIPAGSSVTALVGSANHDERHFDEPDRFDVHRPPGGQMGFGHGIHLCLGHQMARMEMAVALEVLLDRMPDLRLDPDVEPPSVTGLTFRAPTHLRVRWD